MKKAPLLLLAIPIIAGAIYLRSLASWRPKTVFRSVEPVSHLAFSSDGKTLLVTQSLGFNSLPIVGRMTALDTTREFQTKWEREDVFEFGNPQFLRNDSQIFTDGSRVQILDAATGKTYKNYPLHGRATISPDGKWLASPNFPNRQLAIYPANINRKIDLKPLRATKILGVGGQNMSEFAFSPDSQTLAVGVLDKTGAHLDIYSTKNWTRQRTQSDWKYKQSGQLPDKDTPTYTSVQWSRDGRLVLSQWTEAPANSREAIKIRRASDGQTLNSDSMQKVSYDRPIHAVLNTGNFLYTIRDGNVFLSKTSLRPATAEQLLSLPSERITAATLSPDGSYLVAGTQSGRVFWQRVK